LVPLPFCNCFWTYAATNLMIDGHRSDISGGVVFQV
jgi:hypothetical protein